MTLRTVLLLLLALSPEGREAAAQAGGRACLRDLPLASGVVADVQMRILFSRGDSTHLARGGLLLVDTSEVRLAIDEPTCAAAVAAYNRETPRAGLTRAYVVRVGPERYEVWDLRDPTAHYHEIMVFDAAWQLVKRFAG